MDPMELQWGFQIQDLGQIVGREKDYESTVCEKCEAEP